MKHDETFSPIFSLKIGIYGVGIRFRGATRWAQPTKARLEGVARPGVSFSPRAPPPMVLGPSIFFILE